MKKHLLLLFATLLPLLASAYDFEVDGIYYNINSTADKTVSVSSRARGGYSGDITIPATVTYDDVEYSVTSIVSSAFSSCRSLTNITIPEGVTSIGEFAFSGCSSLTSITIPESVTEIGDRAFSGCTGELYVNCNIPSPEYNGNDKIGIFYNSSFSVVTFGDNVSIIGNYAFNNCSLPNFNIPEGITQIGAYAFSDCEGLTSIKIPESVTKIGKDAFKGTEWYNNQPDGAIYLNGWLLGFKNITATNIEIDKDTKGIAGSVFEFCKFENITLPEKIKFIGDNAFYGCSSLTAIIIPESVKSIGGGAFCQCI